MATTPAKAQVTIVKDVTIEAGSREEALKKKDEKVKGEMNQAGNEAVQNSAFGEVKAAIDKSNKAIREANNKYKKAVRDTMSNLTPEKLIDAMGGGPNKNTMAINKGLGVFKDILCWDGDLSFLSLAELLNLLNFNFDFLLSWNICGRQGLVNPLDKLLRSISMLEGQINELKNLDKRLLNNLKDSINGFIRNSGLPQNLANCMLNSSFLSNAESYRSKTSLEGLRDVAKFLNADICKKSDEGIPAKVNEVEKTAMTPFVSGLAGYPKETMYACTISLVTNPEINPNLVISALMSSYIDKENPNTVALLEMIALVKAITLNGSMTLPNNNKIGDLNNVLINSSGSSDAILDKALESIESQTTVDKKELLSTVDTDGYIHIPDLNPEVVLKNMADDVSSSPYPDKDLEKIKKLLGIAMPNFKPENYIGYLSESKTLGVLLDYTIPNRKEVFEITNRQEQIGQVQVDYLELTAEEDPFFNAYIVKESDKELTA